MDILIVKNLTKRYGDKEVFSNISFTIPKGKFIFLCGENGSGKTTLFKAIMQMVKVDDGKILIDDTIIKKKTDICFITDQVILYDNLTVSEMLALVLDINDIKKNTSQKQEILKHFYCEEIKNKKIKQCSLGMKKRVQLMCGMVLEPKLMLMDEFFSGIDSEKYEEIKIILKEYVKNGNTVIMTSHIKKIRQELAELEISM